MAACIFQSTSEAVVKKASMLSDMHFRNLRQKMLLRLRTEEAAKKLEVCVSTTAWSFPPLFAEHVLQAWSPLLALLEAIKVSELLTPIKYIWQFSL